MTIEEIRHAVRDRLLTVIAQETGLGLNTLVRLRKGHTKPHKRVVQVLERYLSQ